MVDPNATSGMYTHQADGTQFFCDMGSTVVQYDELKYGAYNSNPAGYTLITGATLATAIGQQAFIGLFNYQLGIPVIAAFTSGNVCVTTSTGGGQRLYLNGSVVFGGQNGTSQSNYQAGMLYTLYLTGNATTPTPPMPANYFTVNPPTDAVNCGDTNNPALWFKKH
jgi:hypothetical protein